MEEVQILSEIKDIRVDMTDLKQDVSDEMKGMKVDIDYLISKTGRHDTELNERA
ncbi:hypothetical protein [Metabacillus sp. B2-18]|uniref:hypothetical protein n=1 Tax=Metabacillus sp. B2-18 TaxID=2897333 RepID=UPI001E31A92D|nr:hypothetical protein [Metabacillus sp. B2-18]UGB33213.1 hypothetical protein LPC09_12660 [Metabacillus sp. B2-18]